jgi:hypothetical protein
VIDNQAFFGCWSLESITFALGSRLQEVGQHAFKSRLLKTMNIPIPVRHELSMTGKRFNFQSRRILKQRQ